MELYTLDRGFRQIETIDKFDSVIWTERYFGDGDFEINVEQSSYMMSTLLKGQLIMCNDSDIPMILEDRQIKDGRMKVTGIELTKWFNNRWFRRGEQHAVKEWVYETYTPGALISELVRVYCIAIGSLETQIPLALLAKLVIPGLVQGTIDNTGSVIKASVPFGPLYDAIRSIAATYGVGMKTKLDFATASSYQISFNTYKGVDRTSAQSSRPVIQFSKDMDSLTDITDLESISDYKNLIFTYAGNAPESYWIDMGDEPGIADLTGSASGFDVKSTIDFFDDFVYEDKDNVSIMTPTKLLELLAQKAQLAISSHKSIALVDGEVVQTGQINYKDDYTLGDTVELKGNTGALQNARVTEYIRSQDKAGERAYPTLELI